MAIAVRSRSTKKLRDPFTFSLILQLTPCMNKFEVTLLIGELVLSVPLKKPGYMRVGGVSIRTGVLAQGDRDRKTQVFASSS